MGRMPPPKAEGFYWAKWKIADDGTVGADDGALDPNRWEVVDVFRNHLGDDPAGRWRVLVPGVQRSQSLENFYWGPGPLTRPGRMAD